jgi:hypothetical protein
VGGWPPRGNEVAASAWIWWKGWRGRPEPASVGGPNGGAGPSPPLGGRAPPPT